MDNNLKGVIASRADCCSTQQTTCWPRDSGADVLTKNEKTEEMVSLKEIIIIVVGVIWSTFFFIKVWLGQWVVRVQLEKKTASQLTFTQITHHHDDDVRFARGYIHHIKEREREGGLPSFFPPCIYSVCNRHRSRSHSNSSLHHHHHLLLAVASVCAQLYSTVQYCVYNRTAPPHFHYCNNTHSHGWNTNHPYFNSSKNSRPLSLKIQIKMEQSTHTHSFISYNWNQWTEVMTHTDKHNTNK